MGAFSVGPCGQGAAVGRDRLTDSRFGGNPQFRIREPTRTQNVRLAIPATSAGSVSVVLPNTRKQYRSAGSPMIVVNNCEQFPPEHQLLAGPHPRYAHEEPARPGTCISLRTRRSQVRVHRSLIGSALASPRKGRVLQGAPSRRRRDGCALQTLVEGIALHGEDNPAKSHPPCAEGISIVQRSFAPQLKARTRVEH
jgi:hypothetical protein